MKIKPFILSICLFFLPFQMLSAEEPPSLKGTIESIEIYGCQFIKERMIRREITLKVGEEFNLEKAFESKLNIITNLGHIKSVCFFVEPGSDCGKLKVSFVIEESNYYSFTLNAGYEENGLFALPSFKVNNLLHRGLQLSATTKVGNKDVNGLSLNFFEPWLFNSPSSFRLTLKQDEYKRADSPYNTKGYYWIKRDGLRFNFNRRSLLKRNIRASMGYRYEKVTIKDTDNNISSEIKDLSGQNKTLSSLSLHFIRDKRRLQPYTPRYEIKIEPIDKPQQVNLVKGSKYEFLIESSNKFLNSNYNFTKYNLDMKSYILTTGDHELILSAKLGYISGNAPFYERFSIAGIGDSISGNGVRGYSERGIPESGLGGEKMLVVGAEYNVPLTTSFIPFFFYEGGYACDKDQKIDLNDMMWGVGMGLKMSFSFIGNLTLNLGYGLNKNDWQVCSGSYLGE